MPPPKASCLCRSRRLGPITTTSTITSSTTPLGFPWCGTIFRTTTCTRLFCLRSTSITRHRWGFWGGAGGGVFVRWFFPAHLLPSGPHSQERARCNSVRAQSQCVGAVGGMTSLPYGGSRQVSPMSSVSRAYSLLCRYLPEEVPTRVETEDEEVRAAGRTYRTPRRNFAPSAALVEGRAPVLAPNSPGGADHPSFPWCLCLHFRTV